MKKLLYSFEYPFILKIFVRSQQAERTIYTQRKIVYVGEFNNENVLNAIKELFPPSQYIERFVNKSNIAEFPAYKILISTVDENFSQTYFFDLKK